MALLAAPVSAPAEEPWLRACAGAGLEFHVVRAGDGGEAGLGRGLEELLRLAEQSDGVWVARLAGPAESVAYGASVIDAGGEAPAAGAESFAVALPSSSQAMAAVVDGCAGAGHKVVLVQCDASATGAVRDALARGDLGAAMRPARVAVLRDASCGWAVVGLRPGLGALLWRVAVPAPAQRLPGMPAPSPGTVARLLATARAGLPEKVAVRLRVPSRLRSALAAVLIAVVAVGGAGWVIAHRSQPGSTVLGPISWGSGAGVPPNTPPPREAAMAATWDRTAEVILFGGAEAGSGHGVPYADTWRGALPPGAAWQQVTTATSPPARLAGAAASDPADGYVLLYGGEGTTDDGRLGDTWTYAGGWTQRQPAHSPPPGPALAATEPGTGRVLLATACCVLGAVPTGERMQTWRWDGSDWLALGPAPGWVTTASLVADGWDGTVVMVAARGEGLGSTFIWDGSAWRPHNGGMQPPVAPGMHPQLSYDPRSHTVLDVVTGPDGRHATWAWDGTAWTVREGAGGPPVIGLVLAEPVDGHAVLYGGTGAADEFTQRWYWTGTGWAESIRPPAVAAQPAPAFAEATTTDPGSGGLVLFGGSGGLDETWVWSGSDWTQAFFTTPAPPPRQGASMAYDPVSRQALLVGGVLAGGAPAADMWVWRGHSWTRVVPPGGVPPPSSQAPMAWDGSRGAAVLVVPSADGGPLPTVTTWVWDGLSWSQRSTAVAPPMRAGSSMAYDPVSGGVLLMVPCCQGSPTVQSETWRWDGAAWSRLQTAHSPPLHASIALDVARSRVLLVAACCAGFDGDTIGPPETWSWDGVDWTRVADASLPALQDVGAVATDASGAVVLVGRLAGAGPRHPLDGLWRWTGSAWEREF